MKLRLPYSVSWCGLDSELMDRIYEFILARNGVGADIVYNSFRGDYPYHSRDLKARELLALEQLGKVYAKNGLWFAVANIKNNQADSYHITELKRTILVNLNRLSMFEGTTNRVSDELFTERIFRELTDRWGKEIFEK